MKKKLLKLAKALSNFNLDDILPMFEIEESELNEILKELVFEEKLKQISETSFLYIPNVPNKISKTKSDESNTNIELCDFKPLELNLEEIKGYEQYLKATDKQKEYADKYFNLLQASGHLRGQQLKDFIYKKWNKVFPEQKSSYTSVMRIRKSFFKNGFYAILPLHSSKNKGTSCVKDEIFELFKKEYFSPEAPPLTEAVRIAKEKFVSINPDIAICQLPSFQSFDARLKRDYSEQEIAAFRQLKIKGKLKSLKNTKKEEIQEENLLFKVAAEKFLEQYKKGRKKSTYVSLKGYINNHLNPALGNYKLADITQARINKLIKAKSEEGFSLSSINSYIDAAEQIIRHFLPKSNKLKKTEMHKKNRENFYLDMRILEIDEIKKLITVAKNYYPDFYPLVLTAITTGLTRGEILGLTWDCVDLYNKKLNIRKSLYRGELVKHRTKYSIREVYLTDDTLKALAEWKLNTVKSDFVFPDKNGNTLDPDNMIKRRFNPLVEKSGIKKIRFLDLRDTYAALLIKQNLPLTYVQQQLGHSSVDVTVKRYEKQIEQNFTHKSNILIDIS